MIFQAIENVLCKNEKQTTAFEWNHFPTIYICLILYNSSGTDNANISAMFMTQPLVCLISPWRDLVGVRRG